MLLELTLSDVAWPILERQILFNTGSAHGASISKCYETLCVYDNPHSPDWTSDWKCKKLN